MAWIYLKESDAEAVGLFATGCWLEMQDLIDGAIESILRQMGPETISFLISFGHSELLRSVRRPHTRVSQSHVKSKWMGDAT